MKKFFSYILTIGLVVSSISLVGCQPKQETQSTGDAPASEQSEPIENTDVSDESAELPHPLVKMTIAGMGDIEIELYPEVAPNTVNNFISLIEKDYYNGLTFHRIIKDFMIQGGDPEGTGSGGPGYSIKGEFNDNGFENNLKHTPGVISMARTNQPDSAGSQFFIMHKEISQLDGQYAAFGQVISGMDIVDSIANVEVDKNDKPKEDVIMETVTIDLNGYEAPEPDIIK